MMIVREALNKAALYGKVAQLGDEGVPKIKGLAPFGQP